jgi:peptidoglycan/LPS O-acetylase OafA/YrhL
MTIIFKKFYRPDIQSLRGVSVLAVILFHANKDVFKLGFLGVDVFFVISGFVVTPLILRIFDNKSEISVRVNNFISFLTSRFYRLVPALACTILISSIVITLLDPFSSSQNVILQGVAALLAVANLVAYKYSGDYFNNDVNPLIHTWSLSVEWQIYFLLPIILIIFFYRRIITVRLILICFTFLSFISFLSFLFPMTLDFVYARLGIEETSSLSFYSPITRLWQFTIGGICFVLSTRFKIKIQSIKSQRLLNFLILTALALILFSSVPLNSKIGTIFSSIITLLVISFQSFIVLPNKIKYLFEWIGDRSYSIYLVHMPLIYVLDEFFKRYNSENVSFFLKFIPYLMLVFMLGNLNYKNIEVRFRNTDAGKKLSKKYKVKSLSLSLLLPLVFLIPLMSQQSNDMYKDRLDDGSCKFWTPLLNKSFYSRFNACASNFGKATIILGDSHALNIYNAMFQANKSEFLIGIAKGGCRPKKSYNYCPYNDFEKFISANRESVSKVFFHQSGSYLISDLRGNVDTDLAFTDKNSFRILRQDITKISEYLNKFSTLVPTVWLGPFPEARINSTLIEVWINRIEANPVVETAFVQLEEEIRQTLDEKNNYFEYLSLLDNLGETQYKMKFGDCLMFRDNDHWSICAEKIFSEIFIKKNIY